MSKEQPLWHKLYFDPLYTAVARIIGYEGKSPFEFWDAAKDLKAKFGESAVMFTMMNLTRYDKREASPPRYEFTAPVRQLCWQLLGPPPEKENAFYTNADGTPMERPKKEAPPEKREEPKPAAKQRTSRRKK